MAERSAPQVGIGFFTKTSYARRRNSRIQSGSPLKREISSTTSRESPGLPMYS